MASGDTANEFKKYIGDYIEQHDCYGTRLDDDRVPFVPHAALQNFWIESKVVSILCRTLQEERIRGDIPEIRENYLVVFSILVSISRPQFITSILSSQTTLGDRELPFDGVPNEWTDDMGKRAVMEEFQKAQWKFCPLSFDRRLYKSGMSPHRIIPITSKTLLDPNADEEEDDVLVYEANWHPDCLGFLPSSKVVLKEYRILDKEVKATLENEIDIYTNLGEDAFEYIIQYFGSFEQQGKITIVLEHAAGGNLVEFWAKTAPPTTAEEKLELWNSFFQLLLGLNATHNLKSADESQTTAGQWLLKGIHQDIRPQNILITGREPGTFKIYFKLTDFGTGHVRRCRSQGLDTMGDQRRGNGMYSAPESYRDNNISRPQLCECDIWSLGSVASELLVWSTRGDRRRLEYQSRRCTATGATSLAGGFHEGSFHNGEIRLPEVEEEHKTIDESDMASQAVSRIILGHMVVADVAHRSNALNTYDQWVSSLTFLRHYAGRPISRRDTRDSHYSMRLSMSKRQSVNSILSSPPAFSPRVSTEDPWLEHEPTPFSTEPGAIPHGVRRNQGHNDVAGSHLENGKHVEFVYETENGEGPSIIHGPEPGSAYRNRRGTRDSIRFGSSVPSLSHTKRPEAAFNHPVKSAPTFPFRSVPVTPPRRAGTVSSAGPPPASPPATIPRRTTADEFHSVEEFDESSTPDRTAGLGINTNSATTKQMPSPPNTPPNQINTIVSTAQDGPSTSGLKGVPRIRRAQTIISEAEKITINNVYDAILSGEKGKSSFLPKRIAPRPNLLAQFSRLKKAVERLKGLNGREQIFIIDDSESMREHRHEMSRTVRVLARLLKEGGVDPDRHFTMYYACSLRQVSLKNATGLEGDVLEHTFAEGDCNFGVQLDEIISHIKSPYPVSIYVLTNGRWNADAGDSTNLCKVDAVMERILNNNKMHSRQNNHVGFQFIRFFRRADDIDDKEGKQRLDFLDNCLADQFQKLGMAKSDIIDTTDWDDDVLKMLLGGVFTEEDNAVSP